MSESLKTEAPLDTMIISHPKGTIFSKRDKKEYCWYCMIVCENGHFMATITVSYIKNGEPAKKCNDKIFKTLAAAREFINKSAEKFEPFNYKVLVFDQKYEPDVMKEKIHAWFFSE